MTWQSASFLPLRWLLVLLISLTWVTTGSAAASAERNDFGHSLIAAKTPAVSFRKGSPVQTVEGYDWAMLGSDEARIAHVVEKYGFNFNKGQVVRPGGDLGTNIIGKTVSNDPRTIWVSNTALRSEEELAITIAHELRHSRAYLGSGSNSEFSALLSQERLRSWIRGRR